MQIVTVGSTLTVPVEHGRSTITLEGGKSYVMHDGEVAGGREAGVFTAVEGLPPRPVALDASSPLKGRLLMPFIGGLGDAISMLPVLASLKARHPGLQVDVATTAGPAEVFALAPCVDRILAYPMPDGEWRGYDHFLTMETVFSTAQPAGQPLSETFAAALGVELVRPRVELKLPRAVEAAGEPSMVPLIGLAVGEPASLRSYPQAMLSDLVGQLVRRGLGVVLFGHADPSWSVPVCPPVITDMRSRTPTVIELAVWLRAVDVVICHDSFVMHLAGALERPAIGLFGPTSGMHARPYDGVVPVAAGAECAPCHAASGACPRGLDRCVAWDDPKLHPDALAALVLEHLGRQGRQVAGDGFAAAL